MQLGQVEAALSEMLRKKTETVEIGGVFATWLFVALGNGYLASDSASEGVDVMTEGLELCRSSGVRVLESEMHRLKGELLLKDGKDKAAAESFRDAIDVARRQSAKSWELRATTSLARLLASQGRSDEAGTMLAEIYGWFTEGFETADLREARQLLEQLGA